MKLESIWLLHHSPTDIGFTWTSPWLPQNAREAARPAAALPRCGSLHVLPSTWTGAGKRGGVLLRLVNASDAPRTARIGSGILELHAAMRCDLFGKEVARLNVSEGTAEVDLAPREQVTVNLVPAMVTLREAE